MEKLSVKAIGEFFHTGDRPMTPKDMIREWKTCPADATDEQRRTMLTAEEKEQIREGIQNGTLTY